ncbi:WavE lipopolysaccharide synthesis family protein [Longimicrobium terrae]|uniref:LPS biosynthesis protein WavE n=1 Tax=Longimicrobium terrae TaxID=1639882 RepID=A0A841GUA3_9BACT|nr:WavE lipopolysaccharide synthesis family protein [Longimicrobium terrae]MBB4634496.1 hypothetical protein [Longimicrobium terrae]MBB6068614.1 hypothetical protein [Longimicrobium terrae]NNC27800.1 hypothetical protein [Longimicrobium terrae]
MTSTSAPGEARAPRRREPVRSGQISVVVQGPVMGAPDAPPAARLTQRCLQSVRRHLPDAEIVLSTWRGSDVSGLHFDVLVESDDPGGPRCDDPAHPGWGPVYYNADRQAVSTYQGLRAASRPYAMKLRSDMLLTGTGFLRYFGRYRARSPQWRLFRERVVVPNYFSRNPRNRLPYPFHPSDWFQFGLREDLLDLWNSPPLDPSVPRWYEHRPHAPNDPEPWVMYRYTVEQWVWLSFLRRHGEVPFEHKCDDSPEALDLSDLAFANNLVVADRRALGIRFAKYPVSVQHAETLYTHREWQALYAAFCDPDARVEMDLPHVSKRLYSRYLAGAHSTLLNPRMSRAGAVVSAGWERRSPASFRVAKRLYSSVWAAVDRIASR